MKIGNFNIDKKTIVTLGSICFTIYQGIDYFKTKVITMSQQITNLQIEIVNINQSIKDKFEEHNKNNDKTINNLEKNYSREFSEYKLRNNLKLDKINADLFNLSKEVAINTTMGKANSRFLDIIKKKHYNINKCTKQ